MAPTREGAVETDMLRGNRICILEVELTGPADALLWG